LGFLKATVSPWEVVKHDRFRVLYKDGCATINCFYDLERLLVYQRELSVYEAIRTEGLEIEPELKCVVAAMDDVNVTRCIGYVRVEVQGRLIKGDDLQLCRNANHAGYQYGPVSEERFQIDHSNTGQQYW
jgi:hypothetical protein